MATILAFPGAAAPLPTSDRQQALKALRESFTAALFCGTPNTAVYAPGCDRRVTAEEVLRDALLDDMLFSSLIELLGAAIEGESVETLAQLLVGLVAERHAAFHVDDVLALAQEA